MPKTQIFLIIVLVSCVTFVSCDRERQIMAPVLQDDHAVEPVEEMEPADTMEPSDMTDMSDPLMADPSVVINELMADNDNIHADPQGEYDDWLELYNPADTAVLLTGMYLTDKEDEPTQWTFPENTEIPANGYLVVWLDDDEDAPEGLHANFKLSSDGETVMLVDTDARGNQVLDSITFEEQETDVAFGRLPDGTGDFQIVQATPGAPNMAQ